MAGRKVKHIIAVLVVVLLFIKRAEAQQNIQFSQYIFNSMSVNPAYAGYKEEWYIQMGLRSQWIGIEGAPETISASIDGILDPLNRKTGVGFQITSDHIGPQSTTNATFNYAYRLQLDQDDTKRLSFGIGAGLARYALRGDLLNPIEENDHAVPLNSEQNIAPDFRVGIYYNSSFVYAGLSMLDVLSSGKDYEAFDNSTTLNINRRRHLYFIAGGLINLTYGIRLRPSLLVKEDFKAPTSVDLNGMVIFNDKIWGGISYRTDLNLFKDPIENVSKQNSIAGIFQVFVSSRLRLGYSYDYVTSELGSSTNGSHELTVGLTFGKTVRELICPKVF
jgi:type IX secretion system PorP/SprF family membrane protein